MSLDVEELPLAEPVREAKDADLPEQLASIIEALGSQTNFVVTINRLHEPSGRFAQVGQMKRLPDPDEIGKLYGGGEYRLIVQWRTQGATRGRPNSRTVDFILDSSYTTSLNESRQRSVVPIEPKQEIENILTLAERIARMNGGGSNTETTVVIVSALEKLMDRIDRAQEKNDERFLQLFEKIATPVPQVHPLAAWRESMEFAKEMGLPVIGQQEDKRETWLEVADLVANNVGKFLEMLTEAQKSKIAQVRMMANPMARKVVTQGSKAMQNPETRAKMIEHLDAKVGKETTDTILKGLGVER